MTGGDRVVPAPTWAADRIRSAERLLVLGIGGGGDVVGALAVAEAARALGTSAVIGGLTWERLPVDPLPGPRTIDELVSPSAVLHPAVALAGPDTTGPGGFAFAESRMAAFLGADTVLVDPTPGPTAVAEGLVAAASTLGCDLVVLLDVGGDVLAHGDEAGLASPLADAVLLAAAPALAAVNVPTVLTVFGAGCDGELRPQEVAARHDEVTAAGGDLGDLELTAPMLDRLEEAIDTVFTEASAMAVRCARGETGRVTIRDGHRTVELTADGGRLRCMDPIMALRSAARVAATLDPLETLEEAHRRLTAMGIRTELAHELDAASTPR